jgi:hypothetical protein
MAITLADAQKNCQSDIDFSVIDHYRRSSWLLDQLQFDDCVNPAGGGATLTYGYTRLVNARLGAFRAINSEYTPGKATRTQATVDLKPVGDAFEVDRVLANLGPAATNEVAFQMGEAIKGATNKFVAEIVNGDTAVDTNGFDGLDKILTGSSTEFFGSKVPDSNEYIDWTSSTVSTEALAHSAIDVFEEFLSLVVGGADAVIGNRKSIGRLRALARRAGYYTRGEDSFGNLAERYGNTVLIDAGTKVANESTTETDIVATESRDVDGDSGGTTAAVAGLTDLYAVNFGLDAFHGVSTVGQLVKTWLPDFSSAGAVKKGEVEMGPVAVALKRTTGAAVLRNIKVL